jgi:hypothetical protein
MTGAGRPPGALLTERCLTERCLTERCLTERCLTERCLTDKVNLLDKKNCR